jgi:thiamine transport system permease protein
MKIKIQLPLILISILIFSPYFVLLLHSNLIQFDFNSLDKEEIIWAVKNSSLQSLGSALFSVILSLLLSAGILSQSSASISNKFLSRLVMMPIFLPSLFSILLILTLINPFPTGTLGIILVHGFVFSGYLASAYSKKVMVCDVGLVNTAIVFSAKPFQILKLIVQHNFKTLKNHFYLAFAFSFTSFAIPLAVGGGRGTNLEILIYEKVKISADWVQASILALFQLIILLIFSTFLNSRSYDTQKNTNESWPTGASPKAFLVFPILYVALFVFGLLYFSLSGWTQLIEIPFWQQDLFAKLVNSIVLALSVGCLTAALLAGSLWAWPQRWFRVFINGYTAPSTALIGFSSIYFLANVENPEITYTVAFSLLIVAGLYRMSLDVSVQKLSNQVEAAQVLGVNTFKIWSQIVLPQTQNQIFRLAGLASIWCMGDFALSKIIFSNDNTLALYAEGLMSSYRIDSAFAVSGLILLCSLFVYLFFEGLGYVYSRKYR